MEANNFEGLGSNINTKEGEIAKNGSCVFRWAIARGPKLVFNRELLNDYFQARRTFV